MTGLLSRMVRIWKTLLLIAILAPVAVAQTVVPVSTPPDRHNLSQLFSFDSAGESALPKGWRGGPRGTIGVDHQITHTGPGSARLEGKPDNADAFSVLTADLPVDFAGGTVTLRGYLRTAGVEQFAGLWLREDGASGSLALNNMQEQGLRGTFDWKQYTISLPLQAEARRLYFGVLLTGPGTAWADDLELLLDGKPIAEASATAPKITVLDRDHEFDGGSKLRWDTLSPLQIDNLATLARVWGFLKYHHPTVTTGQRQWDYELFRILPAMLNAHTQSAANELLVQWTKGLGDIPACGKCSEKHDPDLQLVPDLAWTKDTRLLGQPLSAQLQHLLLLDRRNEQFYVSLAPIVHNPLFTRELPYPDIPVSDSGYQLLALFRFWNILQYWYPYREVSGEPWPETLREFIPRVALAKDKASYELAMMAFIARVNDTHANLWSSLAVRPPMGECQLPVNIRFVEGKAVVTSFASSATDSSSGLAVGDVLEQIDGSSIGTLVRRWQPFYADSNEAARSRDMARTLTNGSCGPVNVTLARRDQTVRVDTTRVPAKSLNALSFTHDLKGPTFQLLSKQVAYIKLSSVKAADLPSNIRSAGGTRGLIIDIRNYPSEFVPFALGSLFVTQETPFARLAKAELSHPGAFVWGDTVVLQPAEPHYPGKVVILVDEDSQSQAEYTAMAFQASPNTITTGSQTAGADGNVSEISLPGGLSTMISGIGVFYPNKQPTQRVGVHIDVHVEPTIRGVQEGRDEVLEEAIRQILGKEALLSSLHQ